MRTIIDHVVTGDTANQLTITVLDEPGQGGANHEYTISAANNTSCRISFQNGPIKDYGVNGITQETLLAIVIDRLRCFQAGPFACDANQQALDNCEAALYHLQERTRNRIARGVEGTNKQ